MITLEEANKIVSEAIESEDDVPRNWTCVDSTDWIQARKHQYNISVYRVVHENEEQFFQVVTHRIGSYWNGYESSLSSVQEVVPMEVTRTIYVAK